MSEFIEFSLLGLLSGGVIALVALSFVLIYKGTGVVNFAVGEVMMLGAYLYYAGAVTFGLAALARLPRLAGGHRRSRHPASSARCCGRCRASRPSRC